MPPPASLFAMIFFECNPGVTQRAFLSRPQKKKACYLIEITGFLMVAGTGFEPVTFRL
jgi:hypothetical protein